MNSRRKNPSLVDTRNAPFDSFDPYATPRFASRILHRLVLTRPTLSLPYNERMNMIEPSCGNGQIVEALTPFFHSVIAHDVIDWGYKGMSERRDFMIKGRKNPSADWLITNPPYSILDDFMENALTEGYARKGVAMILRLATAEGQKRYKKIWSKYPPAVCAVFSKRVLMKEFGFIEGGGVAEEIKGGQSKIAYAWWVWDMENPTPKDDSRMIWIPAEENDEIPF